MTAEAYTEYAFIRLHFILHIYYCFKVNFLFSRMPSTHQA